MFSFLRLPDYQVVLVVSHFKKNICTWFPLAVHRARSFGCMFRKLQAGWKLD
uniref:Uncharacterized protein n=1 Tax=Arundo donax TaxID=35708 RepID=A0A0A9DME3_ARUDO